MPKIKPSFFQSLIFIVIASLLCLCVIFWANRFKILEDYVADKFADQGLKIDLQIGAISSKNIHLNDITISQDGADIFSAKTVKAQYNWRQAVKGQFTRIELQSPQLDLQLDHRGHIINTWLPKDNSQSANPPDIERYLPREGLFIKAAQLLLTTPYGQVHIKGQADIMTFDDFTAQLELRPSSLDFTDMPIHDKDRDNVAAIPDGLKSLIGLKADNISGDFIAVRSKDKISVEHNIKADTMSHKSAKLQQPRLMLKGDIYPRDKYFTGEINLAFSSLTQADLFLIKTGHLNWTGLINPEIGPQDNDSQNDISQDDIDQDNITQNNITQDTITDPPLRMDGNWSFSADYAALSDKDLRRKLAAQLSFDSALSATPIIQNFMPDVNAYIADLLSGYAIDAQGQLKDNHDYTQIFLTSPIKLYNPSVSKKDPFAGSPFADNTISDEASPINRRSHKAAPLSLFAQSEHPAYHFDKTKTRLRLALDAALPDLAGAQLQDIDLRARSQNGFTVQGVEHFSTKIITAQNWRVTGLDGRPDGRLATLRPTQWSLTYAAPIQDDQTQQDNKTPPILPPRQLKSAGSLNYDGPLPGGYVNNLQLAGALTIKLPDTGKISGGFTPADHGRLSLDSLKTPSGWTLYDLTAKISETPKVFNRNRQTGHININSKLTELSADIIRESDKAASRLDLAELSVKGQLTRAGADDPFKQNWQMVYTDVHIHSDDLPGPDTRLHFSGGDIAVERDGDNPPIFDLTAITAQIKTQLVNITDMGLRVHGQADDLAVEHQGGTVKLTGNDLPAMPISGLFHLIQGHFKGQAQAELPQADNTPINIDYDIFDGTGYADVTIDSLIFNPKGLQPQSLIKALKGKIAQVDGQASAKIRLNLTRGKPLKSQGIAKIIDMSFGTAPGPLKGLNMELVMDSVLPLISRGRQQVTIAEFDPGIPLQNGVVDFELTDSGVKIYSAKWPIGDGFFSLDPFTWRFGADENRFTLRLSEASLGHFMESMGNDNIEATGKVTGTFPIIVSGVKLRVDKGQLSVKEGGTIRYTSPNDAGAEPLSYSYQDAINILRKRDHARYATLARDALREFKYKELSIAVDGALDGEVEFHTIFNGFNPKVLDGQPFEFDINVTGELFNIFRSFGSNAHIKSQLEKKGLSTKGLNIQ